MIFIDDGQMICKVIDVSQKNVTCLIIKGGTIYQFCSMHLKGMSLKGKCLQAHDESDLIALAGMI